MGRLAARLLAKASWECSAGQPPQSSRPAAGRRRVATSFRQAGAGCCWGLLGLRCSSLRKAAMVQPAAAGHRHIWLALPQAVAHAPHDAPHRCAPPLPCRKCPPATAAAWRQCSASWACLAQAAAAPVRTAGLRQGHPSAGCSTAAGRTSLAASRRHRGACTSHLLAAAEQWSRTPPRLTPAGTVRPAAAARRRRRGSWVPAAAAA